jgi:signal transduction histidine kinase
MRSSEEGKTRSAGAAGEMPKAADDERHGKSRLPMLPSRKVYAGPHTSEGSREGWGAASLATRVSRRLSGRAAERPVNILLADDDPAKRLAISAILEDMGHRLFVAASGAEAVQLASHRDFALALLDVRMPDLDGYEVARAIRSRKRAAHTPVIFITAFDPAELEMLSGYTAGAVDFIFPPIIPEILRAKVRTFVELAVMRQQLNALNADLKRRAGQLETANQELESFTYSVSHDLRAPLRAINGFAGILKEDHWTQLDEEGRHVLGVILDNSRNMGELLDALLVLARYNATPIGRSEIDMMTLSRAVFGELVLEDGVGWVELKGGALPNGWGDIALVRQVWSNLLSNAIKYSGKRQRPVVEVSGWTEGAEQIYCVKDNGAGFDMHHYERLFGLFQRVHSTADFPGTGIGLAIVQRIVTRHGGRVWAEGKVDEGASFYFSLPARLLPDTDSVA